MSSYFKTVAVLTLLSFTNALPSLRLKRGSYGAPSNYGPPEGQFGSAYGQNTQAYGQNYGSGGGGYGRPSGSYGRPDGGYNRPPQYGAGGYQQGGNFPGGGPGGFQGGPGGFQGGQGGFQPGQSGFQGGQGQFQGGAGGFQGGQGAFQGGQGSQGGFQASPPVPSVPTIGAQQPGLPDAGADYSTVGQKAPVAADPGAGGLFGGAPAGTGFDDPALAADAKPAGKTITDSVSESSATGPATRK